MNEERILNYFKVVNVVNLCGKEAVAFGINARIVDIDHVIEIDGIPHAEAVVVGD